MTACQVPLPTSRTSCPTPLVAHTFLNPAACSCCAAAPALRALPLRVWQEGQVHSTVVPTAPLSSPSAPQCRPPMLQMQRLRALLELLLRAWRVAGCRPLWGHAAERNMRTALVGLKSACGSLGGSSSCIVNGGGGGSGSSATSNGHSQPGPDYQGRGGGGGGGGGTAAGVPREDEGSEGLDAAGTPDRGGDDGKQRGQDNAVLAVRSLQRAGDACVRALKEMLLSGGKMD